MLGTNRTSILDTSKLPHVVYFMSCFAQKLIKIKRHAIVTGTNSADPSILISFAKSNVMTILRPRRGSNGYVLRVKKNNNKRFICIYNHRQISKG